MEEDSDESSSSSCYEDCSMSSTFDQMSELALKFLSSLRSENVEEPMQVNGLEALCQITVDVLDGGNSEEEKERFGETLWLQDINTAMESFPDSVSVQETACRCLTALLQERPSLCQCIGREGLPLPYNISAALTTHQWNSNFFKSACETVLIMLSYSTSLRQEFCEHNLHQSILLKISSSHDTLEVVKAFQVLVHMSRDSPEFKGKLLKEDILSCIHDIFEESLTPRDSAILKQAVVLLGTLADGYSLVTYQCIVEELHLHLLQILTEFHSSAVPLLEVTLDTLGIFCKTSGISDILVTCGCVELTTDLIKNQQNNPDFQVKGLMMLRDLVQTPEDALNVIVPKIKKAMEKYPNYSVLQEKCCEILYNLAKNDHELSTKLVQLHFDQLFFKILANFSDDEGMALNMAADCIYLLACEHDLKNSMMFQMCALGNTTAVSLLLQFSADVNYSEGSDTPLSIACKANNVELVQLLLEKGVTDMHYPLTLCLEEKRRHRLAGFLLKHMGHDEEGGTISLTGLKLGTLRTDWLAPALLGSDTYSSRIASTRWLNLTRKFRQRLSVSTQGSTCDDDEDRLTELSTTGTGFHEDMTSDSLGQDGFSREQVESSFPEGDVTEQSFLKSHHTQQFRHRLGSKLTVSLSESHLMTVAEGSDVKLNESGSNDAFLEENDMSSSSLKRRYSDSCGLPKNIGKNKSMPGKKKSMPRSKSGSMIQGASNSKKPAVKNPVRCLDLSRNEISNVDILAEQSTTISSHLSCIENLDLSHNRLLALPSDLHQNMQRLRKLVLSNNGLSTIPTCVFTCSESLECVDLSHNNIKQVEKPRNHFMSFVLQINLSHNSIEEFPCCVSEGFPLLTHLDLSHNYIKYLPGCKNDMKLSVLESVDRSQKSERPVVNLSKLRTLDLSHNAIEEISATFLTSLSSLETLRASYNMLNSLPDKIAPSLTKLAVVKLSHNNLTEKAPFYLSKFLLWLPNVHTVDVSENGLLSIAAPSVWSTQRLKDLNASGNNVQTMELGKAVGKWSFLTRLDLSNNNLKKLPKGIGELKSLGQLNISGNSRINFLPNEMGKLSKLWEFLHTDVKLDMNRSLLRGRTRDLVGHLRASLKGSAPKPQRKVVICGPQAGGKSTLLRLLALSKVLKKPVVKERRKMKNANDTLQIQTWLINDVRGDCRCCYRRNVSLVLRLWEFSASACVHRCFLTETDLHILVFDASASVEKVDELKPWLMNIHDQCSTATVILVGTHMEKIQASRRRTHIENITNRIRAIRKSSAISTIRNMFFMSGSKNSNVDDLARKLLNLAMACNTKGNEILNHNTPKSFITLQRIVENNARNMTENNGVVHLNFLKKIIQDSKLDINNEELHEAVVCLRQSGLLVNYAKPTAKLNELFFLCPPKLAGLIAKVSSFVVNIADPMELVTQEKLREQIVDEGFPKCYVPQILRLLEDFEIALPVSLCKYLLNSSLPRVRPPALVNTNTMSRRRYIMPYIPVGFWKRLVVHLRLYRKEMARGQRPLIRDIAEDSTFQHWLGGFCSFWSLDINFTVIISENILDIFVPASHDGNVVLASLVYHIDTLLLEWYPDLCGLDSLYGRPKIQKTALCPCRKHEFLLEDCITPYMRCTQGEMIPLDRLVPDLVLAHVDSRYLIDEKDLRIEESSESILGEGGFGSVFRCKFKNKNVAVKIFRKQIESDPRIHLEQEVRFLAKLRHPSIIDLVGVCCGERYIAVLELAPLGSLNQIFRSGKPLSRGIQHLIAMQVTDGLRFLHHHTIVYRDLKPHNILIFSLAAGSLINAKISDFGSSRYATPCGFITSEGTAGYRAPEVARGDAVYNEKADIFSLGILLYELATEGKQPFTDLKFPSEFDEAVITGRPIDPIVVTESPPWPDMQDLLDHMLASEPDDRPTADQVYQRLSNPEFISLKKDIAVCKGQAVECMATRYFSDGGVKKMEVWIGSGASDWTDRNTKNDESTHTSQLSRVDLSATKPKGCKGTILQDGRIISIAVIAENFILVGTQTGHLWVYDVVKGQFVHTMSKLNDAVVCLLHVCLLQSERVFAGLANGELAVFNMDDFKNPPKKMTVINAQVCCKNMPVMCLTMTKSSKRLLCGIGHNIVVFQLGSPNLIQEKLWSVAPESEPHKGLVSNIIADKHGTWTSTKGSTVVQLWSMKTQQCRAVINCDSFSDACEDSTRGMRVVSMMIHNNILWIGTGGGHILLIDTRSKAPLMRMSRHKTAVRCLMTADLLQADGKQISVVLSGGLGFIPRCSAGQGIESSSRDFGYVLVWESGIQKESEHLHEYNKRRQEWHLNHNSW